MCASGGAEALLPLPQALCDFLTRRLGVALKRAGADIRTGAGARHSHTPAEPSHVHSLRNCLAARSAPPRAAPLAHPTYPTLSSLRCVSPGGGWGAAKGGEMGVDMPGQAILERTSVLVDAQTVEARFTVALPAQGRTVLGQWASRILIENLPRYVIGALFFDPSFAADLKRHLDASEDAEALRGFLRLSGLVAFVADGSVLPRLSGASDTPMPGAAAVPFRSPPSLSREFTLPNRGRVAGMGIPLGVTLIVGGGFHGKTTLLKALEVGVYNHIPGDGRELVVTDPTAFKARGGCGLRTDCPLPHPRRPLRSTCRDRCGGGGSRGIFSCSRGTTVAVIYTLPLCVRPILSANAFLYVRAPQIRAEDGRSVSCTDTSPFITNLPFGKVIACCLHLLVAAVSCDNTLRPRQLSRLPQ